MMTALRLWLARLFDDLADWLTPVGKCRGHEWHPREGLTRCQVCINCGAVRACPEEQTPCTR